MILLDHDVAAVVQPGEQAHRVLIMGAGRVGEAFLDILSDEHLVEVVGVFDHDLNAPALAAARAKGIDVYVNMGAALAACEPCLVFNLTGDRTLEMMAAEMLGPGCVIGVDEAWLIWRMLSNLQAAKEDLSYQVMHDVMTGKYNRRFLIESMKHGLSEAMRYNKPYSFALLDIDCFKLINDGYGHAAGDEVLKAFANYVASNVRASDIMGRWGGEEFLILLPHTTVENAVQAVENLLSQIKRLPIDVGDGRTVTISFSAGVTEYYGGDERIPVDELVDNMLSRVDHLMYQAKASGRGCVIGVEKVRPLI